MEEIIKEYHYHIEDGQFSRDFKHKSLLGDEGDIIKVHLETSGDQPDEIYILFIENDYVECIGNIERSFPTNWLEHMDIRNHVQELYKMHELE